MLSCEHLSYGYETPLLRDLNLHIAPGECWAILGKNGAGKSTLLQLLAGITPLQQGHVYWQDKSLSAYPLAHLAQHIGILPQQDKSDFHGNVEAYVALGAYPHTLQNERIEEALQQFDLDKLRKRLYSNLSGGECQRARLAQLWVQDPMCYLLDEPLQNLDIAHQLQLFDHIQALIAQGKICIMVLHDFWALKCCNRALLLGAEGSYQLGSLETVLTQANLEALYQCKLPEFESWIRLSQAMPCNSL